MEAPQVLVIANKKPKLSSKPQGAYQKECNESCEDAKIGYLVEGSKANEYCIFCCSSRKNAISQVPCSALHGRRVLYHPRPMDWRRNCETIRGKLSTYWRWQEASPLCRCHQFIGHSTLRCQTLRKIFRAKSDDGTLELSSAMKMTKTL